MAPKQSAAAKFTVPGMSTSTGTEVATLLGCRVEDVTRFEGPVLAEREHVVGQALAVPVLLGGQLEHDAHPTFGAAVRALRTERGIAQESLANLAGIERSHMGKVERGDGFFTTPFAQRTAASARATVRLPVPAGPWNR